MSAGEPPLHDLGAWPDDAVTVGGVPVGFVEVKAPDKPLDPASPKSKYDRGRWEELGTLPDLLSIGSSCRFGSASPHYAGNRW